MPALTNPRWEKACQLRASGKEIGHSYTEAGFARNPVAATHFFKRPYIIARIIELQEQKYGDSQRARDLAVKKVALEESWIIERAKYVIELALRGNPIRDKDGNTTGQFDGKTNLRAATDALRLCADFKGMRIQRHEVGQPGDFARMSDEDLNSSLIDQAKALGLPETAIDQLMAMQGGSETRQ